MGCIGKSGSGSKPGSGRLWISFGLLILTLGWNTACKTSSPGSQPHRSQYRRSTYDVKIKTINDIQYKGAYKYDTDGKKYKKHFRKKKRRKN